MFSVKFTGQGDSIRRKLEAIQTEDNDILQQIGIAKELCLKKINTTPSDKKETVSNYNNEKINFREQFIQLKDSADIENKLTKLLSKISYEQIGEAVDSIEDIKFSFNWKKYSFVDRDFGLFMQKNLIDNKIRAYFLQVYKSMLEYDLYSYYLDKAGVKYKKKDGSLDYDKIYELIKYDAVTAFVGGGGGVDDNEVYSLIKLLEIK